MEALTPRDRVLSALRLEQPDRVPVVDLVDDPLLVATARLLEVEVPDLREPLAFEELTCRLIRSMGIDSIGTNMPMGYRPADGDVVRDRFGSAYRTSEHGSPVLLEGVVDTAADLLALKDSALPRSEDFEGVRHMRRRLGPSYPLLLWFPDTFKLSWQLHGGMQTLLVDFVRNADLVHALARYCADWIMAVIEQGTEAGADVLLMDGDIAGERGPLFSSRHFDTYLRPYYQEIVAAAHARGVPIVKHTDGDAWAFLPPLAEIGFDGFNPIQPQCMDIGEVKERMGRRLCLIGNIDCRHLLVSGTEDEVEETVRQTIQIAAPGGGFILHSSNSIHPAVHPENFVAMVRACHRHGTYPV